MTFGPGHRGHMRTRGPCQWGTICVAAKELAYCLHGSAELSFPIPPVAQRWRAPPAAYRCVRQLHAAIIRVAKVRPDAIVRAEIAHAMEQELIEALAECLSAGQACQETPAARRHPEVMVRFEDILQTQPSGHLRAKELSAAIRVSERLLDKCCKEVLGMSPTSYIRLRALHEVHRILHSEESRTMSVSRVARSHGFQGLGHFAAAYRSLFGELPSASLSRGLHR